MKDCTMMVKTHLKPGERLSCPLCGDVIVTTSGKVVEIKQEKMPSHSEGSMVMISPERQQMIGITTAPVYFRPLVRTVRVSGKIAYDPELAITQEEFIQALTAEDAAKNSSVPAVTERAKAMTAAARNKLQLLGMTEEQIGSLEETRKVETNLYLPGLGESVWAYISVYEYEIGCINLKDTVELEAVAYPGETFTGIVMSINPVLDPITRTNQVRVVVPNPDNKLKPEMFVNARINEKLGEKLAVPASAVLDTGLRKIVYLVRSNNELESREITLGQKAGEYYEVMSGLAEGDIVVTSGNFLLDSEAKLQAK